ncbi:hypothetical protein AIZ18_18545 [Salmonella enterica subsp. enterica serovar Typhimurium]|uniref:tail fiber domain-containing protein n=1 Tax=Salmonella enterica TaxID=28901 RepID=UPI00077E015B|nr:tail fiber domain-containing protein [Salmonella enterica]KYI63494.1 hypothetical protein AIZ18_18510 [Salmonella enterica subsp. enterica serovar Typhimurium]KYI63501.1 hypothetical protein AIZ18_18545 [Salmonella enterica subsp. enterica serovar Typhimurium]
MLYNTGTIAINGNIATGTDTNWTAPASQIRAGQTIIVLSSPVQIFQISSVDSSTSMTVTPAASPALSGQKYGILVSDIISVDGLAQAMSQLIKEYDENIGAWETFATTSANQNITVTINGTSLSIPAIGKLLQKGSNGALPVSQGGTGATKMEDARTNLGLGNSATRNVGTTSGTVAAGDDSRLKTIHGKTGGIVNGEISLTRSAAENISNRIVLTTIDSAEGITVSAGRQNFADGTNRQILNLGSVSGSRKAVLHADGGVLCRAGMNNFSALRTGYFIDYESGPIALYIDSTRVGTIQLSSTSDRLLKKEIEYLSDRDGSEPSASALNEVLQWNPATFKYKKRGIIPESDTNLGFIANDLVEVSPECVKGKGLEDGYDENNTADAYSLDQVAMIAKLALSIQALQEKISVLQANSVGS